MRHTKGMDENQRKQIFSDFLLHHQVNGFPFHQLEDTDFFRAPASTKWHAAYPGGLFDHSMNVTRQLLSFTKYRICEPWERKDSPIFIGMLHDVTKIGLYRQVQDMHPFKGEIEAFFIKDDRYTALSDVHGQDSLFKIEEMMEDFDTGLTIEEQQCIRYHMGAYQGKSDWPGYDGAIKAYPNVLWTHTADMFASKLMEE